MFLIGLTGGAATGKSTASSYFRSLGVPVIDADEVARKIVEPGEPAFLEIKATFGQDVIDTVTGNIVSFLKCFKSSHAIYRPTPKLPYNKNTYIYMYVLLSA